MATPYDGKVAVWHWKGDSVSEDTVEDIVQTFKRWAPNVKQIWVKTSDGENWMDRVETIPRDPPAVRRAMASYHLRSGRFWCPTVQRTSGCATRSTFLPPAATAGLDDPCLRRDVALWALDQIPEEDIDGPLYAAYVDMIKLRAPERELNQRALARLGEVKSLFLCECLTREHRVQVGHAAAAA